MLITREIIERIEGEATLELSWSQEKIAFAKIKFLNFRGIEKILEQRPFLDALVITPRVCGICNTSHTISAIRAIENAYTNMGIKVDLSNKAGEIREFALCAEKIQNHIKWLYFSILPELQKMSQGDDEQYFCLSGAKNQLALGASADILKAMAIFTGQWPHGSFCIPGGVSCDPTQGDVLEAMRYVQDVTKFAQKEIFGVDIEEFLHFKSLDELLQTQGALRDCIEIIRSQELQNIGKSYDRFISFGAETGALKCEGMQIKSADANLAYESLENTYFKENGYTYSKSALYKSKYFETGPLARMMTQKHPLIRDLHRKYKDSILTRIVARVSEIVTLLQHSIELLESMDISQASCTSPKIAHKNITSFGVGTCEAARGSLIHKIEIQNGNICKYDIITPTVWNLGNGSIKEPSIAQLALIGLDTVQKADLVFKSFDVCAVCTTQ